MAKIKWFAGGFIIFLILIILIANLGLVRSVSVLLQNSRAEQDQALYLHGTFILSCQHAL